MDKKQIRLTEQDLHMLVEDAVKTYLVKEGVDESVWGGLKNVWQGAKNWNFNVGQTYRAGNWASSFNNYAQEAQSALQEMITIARQTKNPTIAKELTNIKTMLGRAAAGYTKMANQVAKGTPMNTSVQDPWAAKAAKTANATAPQQTTQPTIGTGVPGGTSAAAAGAQAGAAATQAAPTTQATQTTQAAPRKRAAGAGRKK